MKIALAHKRLDLTGGTERDFYRTAEGLRDLGHEIHIFCGEFGVPPPEGIRAHRVPCWPLGRTARLLSFAFAGPKAVRVENCQIIVGFGRMIRQDILRSGGGTHKLFLQRMESGPRRRLWQKISLYHRSVLAVERLQFQPANYRKILAVSREVKRDIISSYGVPEEKISVIYNGVDHGRFHPRSREQARESLRGEWGIPKEASVVVFVGSGFKRKGLGRLIRAWRYPLLAGAYLLVVGEDAQRSRWAVWAKSQAPGKIIFTGRQNDVERYYGAADLLALPAFQEAFGNVVLEALASGLPVLLSPEVGAAEILEDDLKNGVLASPDDPAEIAGRIHSLIDPARRQILSEQARNLAVKYSWQNHFRALENHLVAVIEESRRENLT